MGLTRASLVALAIAHTAAATARADTLWVPLGLSDNEAEALRAQIERQPGTELVDQAEAERRLAAAVEQSSVRLRQVDALRVEAQAAYASLQLSQALLLYNRLIDVTSENSIDPIDYDKLAQALFDRATVSLANRERAAAVRDMTIALTLRPALTPDARLHGPPVERLHAQAQAGLARRGTFAVRVQCSHSDAIVRVDGQVVSLESPLQVREGTHLLTSERFGSHPYVHWLTVRSNADANITLVAASGEAVAVQALAALSSFDGSALAPEQAATIARAVDAEDALIATRISPREFRLQRIDVSTLHSTTQRVVLSATLPQNVLVSPDAADLADESEWYEQWYVWTFIGVVVAGATIATILLTLPEERLNVSIDGP